MLQVLHISSNMTSSSLCLTPRTHGFSTQPGLSFGSSSGSSFAFGYFYRRNSLSYLGRKGWVTEGSWSSLLNGFHARSSCALNSRIYRFSKSKSGVGPKSRGARPLEFVGLQSVDQQNSIRNGRTNTTCNGNRNGRTNASYNSIRNGRKKASYKRGMKRTLSTSDDLLCGSRATDSLLRWKERNPLLNPALKEGPSVARKKVKCWNYEEDAGEPNPTDMASLASLEQAIQFQAKEETLLFFRGPAAGDLAEVEAFCRLYRLAEQLHTTVMKALRSHGSIENLDKGPYRDDGDVPEVEEKVASGLAHLMALLHQGKSEVLGLRSMGGGKAADETLVDDLPPFARLRKAVRASCITLEGALNSLLPIDIEQELDFQTKMMKLKNACLDAGFPRPDGIPSHADIPNLAPVRLRPSKSARTLYKGENVGFWRGGHITEAGLEWLVERGFRTIVDLREGSAQPIAQSILPEAVASGKLKVVRMPVERGAAPSKEQVEEFARLVADSNNKPLYLHTRAGVGRASAMVSRWREFVLRQQLQAGTEKKAGDPGILSQELEQLSAPDDVKISQEDAMALQTKLRNRDTELIPENLELTSSDYTEENIAGTFDSVEAPSVEQSSVESSSVGPSSVEPSSEDEVLNSEDNVEIAENEILTPVLTNGSARHHTSRFDLTKNAFEAQRPVNVLSRKAMSKFLKRRKFPPAYSNGRIDGATGNVSTASQPASSSPNGNIAGPANRWGLANPGIPRAGMPEENKSRGDNADLKQRSEDNPTSGSYPGPVASKNGDTRSDFVNGSAVRPKEEPEKTKEEMKPNLSNDLRGDNSFGISRKPSVLEDVEEPSSVEGDMCASTTGVVRLQSRKKAEMFLVRTDGYSCTRERVKESTLAFTHPSTQQQMLMWKTPPRTVLLLKKLGSELNEHTQEVASFLHHQEGMNVMVEPEVHDRLARLPGYGFIQTFYTQDTSELHERVDFVVCLGGDGVILHASNLFRNAVPPVVSFNLGSLGFLTSHLYNDYKEALQAVIHGHNDMATGVYITLRMRLRCELYRNGKAVPGKVFDVLNEVVVDRGSNPYLCKIECYERNRLITKVQADGVIVATPTGSTAYSTAAGGSMVHPNVPCMLFTPICPHSLSFRPVILPDSALLELKVPRDARNNEWVSFDGKKRQQLSRGDSVRICMSEHPLPTVNKNDQTDDWFQSLVRCLNWNERMEQRPLSVE